MPTWASLVDIATTNLDSGSDSPANARADLKGAVDNLNAMRAARGAADGVPSLDSTGKMPSAQLPASVVMRPRTVIKAAGSSTWTVPAGVTQILVRLWGGGGGGGYTSVGTGGDHGGGGGGGGYQEKYFDVTPGAVFNYTVGAGGTGAPNSADGDGNDGADTTIASPGSGVTPSSTTITAQAGQGGKGPANRTGGAGGLGTGGDILIRGGAGGSGFAKGGMGGPAARGSAAQAGAPKSDGYGGGGFGSGAGTSGFDGMNGTIEIWY